MESELYRAEYHMSVYCIIFSFILTVLDGFVVKRLLGSHPFHGSGCWLVVFVCLLAVGLVLFCVSFVLALKFRRKYFDQLKREQEEGDSDED